MNTIKLHGNKIIGRNHPIYIMADIGLTNGGDLGRTKELIAVCKSIGVDAVKMQMIGPDTLLGDKTVEYTYQTYKDGPKTENMYEMFKALTYSEEEWFQIADEVWSHDMEFICTAHYMGAVDILEKIGVNLHKICTWSTTHKRLIQRIGSTTKPIMLDMGASTEQGLTNVIDWYTQKGGKNVVILHDFHTSNAFEMNFLAIKRMRNKFNYSVGYTPQGRDSKLDYMSVGLGVDVLEKRITLDRSIPKNGHNKALEPDEFKEWYSNIRYLESTLGINAILPTTSDLEQSKIFFKSIYAKVDIKQGSVITDDLLECRRPGTGISADSIDMIIGRKAACDISAGKLMSWEVIV